MPIAEVDALVVTSAKVRRFDSLAIGVCVNKLGTWLLIAAILLAVLNLFLFALWWSLIRVEVSMPVSERGYTIEAIALNLTILQMVLGLVGFVVAVLAFFGYSEVKSIASSKAREVAEREAREEAARHMATFIRQMQDMGFTNGSQSSGKHSVSRPNMEHIREAGVE